MHGEHKHDRNQSNNQINAAEKQKKKREASKEENLQPRNTGFQKDFQRTKIQTTIPSYPHLSRSPSSRLIRGPRPMTPTTKKMIQWIGGSSAMPLANTTRTVRSLWTLLRWRNDFIVMEGISESPL